MDRASIKALAIRMLQNRSAVPVAYLDEMIDLVYGHTLVDAVPSLARRGVELVPTVPATASYVLSDEWRALDADYAYRDDGTKIPVYTSQEQWLLQEAPPSGTDPVRVLLYYDDPNWYLEVAPTPSGVININLPGTFYRGALPDGGTPNNNEAMAVMYGAAMHVALIAGLEDIVVAAQAGLKTQIGLLQSQYASERAAPTSLPPRRDF